MTEHTYPVELLGAQPSPADPHDFRLELDTTAGLPARYLASPMPLVLNQNVRPAGQPLGTCVSHAGAGAKSWEERRDGHGWLDFDPFWLYAQCKRTDGLPGVEGTTMRALCAVLLKQGAQVRGQKGSAPGFRIASYAAVPMTEDALKRAVFQQGPVLIATAWYANWMHFGGYVLPRPTGSPIGGHGRWLWGWDDTIGGRSALVRNSWGAAWCDNGSSYDPWRFLLPAMHDAWRLTDRLGD